MIRRPLGSHLLVAGQFAFIALSCYPKGWHNAGGPGWLLICLGGALLGVTALYYNGPGTFSVYPEVRAGARLVTDGPYRRIRHPMYTALMLMMAGVAAFNGHWLNFVAAAALCPVLVAKARREEKILATVFDGYAGYAAATKRFVPYVY